MPVVSASSCMMLWNVYIQFRFTAVAVLSCIECMNVYIQLRFTVGK
jgi:hypothetical protein